MVTFKKASVLLSATALSVGLLAPMASASTFGNERMETLPIQVAQTNTTVTKADLMKRFRALFPSEFPNVTEKDFRMGTGYSHPKDTSERYELNFSKNIDNQYVYGSFIFVGETLELEQFHYQPITSKDVLFPAKYSKGEAQKVADKFMGKFDKAEEYELVPNEINYYSSSILTQPIQYSFTYMKKKSGVSISDQSINISVLGDGTVASYYKTQSGKDNFTYDDPSKVQSESVIANRLQDALKAQLSYRVETDYKTGKNTVKLVYQPNSEVTSGVHALTGDWLTTEGLSSTVPNQTITPIVTKPLAPKQPNLTSEQVQALAQKLLATDLKGVKLTIESVEETTTETGKAVYNIQYMYQYRNGGTGTVLVIDKATGEIINYSNIKNNLEVEEVDSNTKAELTRQQALEKAVAHVKEWLPSYAHQYALPVNEGSYEKYNDSYNFMFPRIVNGLTVVGDQISVSVDAKTGDLTSLHVNAYDNIEWPAATDILTQQEATKLLGSQLKVKLQYVNHSKVENEKHYSLAYQPVFKEGSSAVIDAKTGEWLDAYGMASSDKPTIEHPTAAEELNYLIHAGILEADEKFNPDAAVTKETALKVLLNSVTYMYYNSRLNEYETTNQSFTDIAPDHAIYQFVNRGLKMGMLDTSNGTFNATATLSKQELAKWVTGTLKLSKAAKLSEIYELNYSDAAQVDKELRGYVALAYAMGLLEAENNQLKPKSEVTYAQLAQVTIRLAHKMNEYQIDNY
ncbi:transcriptional antiterminator [Lysinibacillus sp. 2017]|uniref:YcdB/YcdC domain-containing protein n=1 Tax=unclassified Lysinibacillus TaxID=2636778 RepID=UPI000D526F21|nr:MULTISPECIES: YcdB/YcdC domain-containing protein [unclassified Lysinibacillus]AWE08568.1 transcriptional antiterminator [Lysinibacillus sp. 2017]TGN35658.1 transcriptional antiterminator [Lysinibacillus sp. S2017]